MFESNYEYIVVGSGPGGGPLACRLAQAGFKTLLIEAGNDQSANINVSVPAFLGLVSQDQKLRWDVFVNHYQDQKRAQQDPKYVYELSPFNYHVGPNPPLGATPKGILYPRAATLGGCATHNALIWLTPHASDWDEVATLTGDPSWRAENMAKYLDKVNSWLVIEPADPTILLKDPPLLQQYLGGAAASGGTIPPLDVLSGLLSILLVGANSRARGRDSFEGFFQVPITMDNGNRTGVYRLIRETVEAGYPLTVQTDTFVTKVLFDRSNATQPKAVGVEYMVGQYLYRASPLSGNTIGLRGTVKALREVIISAGAFNTPQLLKLSGIGPKDELQRFGIPLVKDLPGVGKNLQDRYEVPVTVQHTKEFRLLENCTFDAKEHDGCFKDWLSGNAGLLGLLGTRGVYASNGLAGLITKRSDYAANSNLDLFTFGGPVNFAGYFPGWGDYTIADHRAFTWYTLKAHTRNRAGTVQLQSSDPLDPPCINFNAFDTGTTDGGADQLDLQALVQAVNFSRLAIEKANAYFPLGLSPYIETRPGPNVTTQEQIEQYIKDVSWGHHASCSAAIGADNDPDAVLDSSFRVRGVDSLRVVDASVFSKIPGSFIQSSIYIISEKAADVILGPLNTTCNTACAAALICIGESSCR